MESLENVTQLEPTGGLAVAIHVARQTSYIGVAIRATFGSAVLQRRLLSPIVFGEFLFWW